MFKLSGFHSIATVHAEPQTCLVPREHKGSLLAPTLGTDTNLRPDSLFHVVLFAAFLLDRLELIGLGAHLALESQQLIQCAYLISSFPQLGFSRSTLRAPKLRGCRLTGADPFQTSRLSALQWPPALSKTTTTTGRSSTGGSSPLQLRYHSHKEAGYRSLYGDSVEATHFQTTTHLNRATDHCGSLTAAWGGCLGYPATSSNSPAVRNVP